MTDREPPPRTLELKAPLSGVLVRLEDVPDPVFAQRIAGDGFSIDPTSDRLCAPAAGTITVVHRAGHAVTLATDDGVDVLMHIGIDTVALEGKGFRPLVAAGARVGAGDPLIEFDADYVATHAKSLLTLVIVTARHGTLSIELAGNTGRGVARSTTSGAALSDTGGAALSDTGGAALSDTGGAALSDTGGAALSGPRSLAAGEVVAIVRHHGAAPGKRPAGETVASPPIRAQHSIHARPAALLASVARRFGSDVRLRAGDRDVNAKSVVSVMSLEIDAGDEVTIVAAGAEAGAAVEAVAKALASGLGEPPTVPVAPPRPQAPTDRPAEASRYSLIDGAEADSTVLRGVPASDGIATGCLVHFRTADIAVAERGGRPGEERARFHAAIAAAKADLAALSDRLGAESDFSQAAIFVAHREILDDPDMVEAAERHIDDGQSAAFAWRAAFSGHADRLTALANPLLASRAQDVRDAGRRVLDLIVDRSEALELPSDSILVAEELTPSQVAALDRRKVVGLCTTTGGPTSHVAILARSLGIPAVVAIDPRALEIAALTPAIVDGARGLLMLSPSPETRAAVRARQAADAGSHRLESPQARAAAVTLDGSRIEVGANAGSVADVARATAAGADGIGLLRTELLFMDRSTMPTEEEQAAIYKEALTAAGPARPVIVRTFDVGGDKPLPWLPMPREDNPFLGVRGVRVGLARPEILETQLRAIARASTGATVRVMFPMIASLDELLAARGMLDEACVAAGVKAIPAGIMVEVPSAALISRQLAADADFFSIGTNDLAQYTLAMDRGHPLLAGRVDALHPAVLRLVDITARAAHDRGRPVAVCGAVAADPRAIPLLVGLGVGELSVPPPAVAAVKAQIRRLSAAACRELAARALDASTAAEVRAIVSEALA